MHYTIIRLNFHLLIDIHSTLIGTVGDRSCIDPGSCSGYLGGEFETEIFHIIFDIIFTDALYFIIAPDRHS